MLSARKGANAEGSRASLLWLGCCVVSERLRLGGARSERPGRDGNATILVDSLAIMLAIVVPTIIATLGFAWWFRAVQPQGALSAGLGIFRPLELIVWAIPLLVIMLLGGVTWIGSHDLDPATPLASNDSAARGPGRLARLEMAVHLPGAACRERQPAGGAGRRAGPFLADLGAA